MTSGKLDWNSEGLKPMRTRIAVLLLAVVTAAAFITVGRAEQPSIPALDRDAIGKIVRDYLMENPEVIEEAMQVLRERREMAQRKRDGAAIAENGEALRVHPMSPASGNLAGDVTVVEFFDYQCGYCKRSLRPVMDLLAADGQVRVVWKEFPILGPVSRFAARARDGRGPAGPVPRISRRGHGRPRKVDGRRGDPDCRRHWARCRTASP